jgi:hypothetical protein
MRQKMFFFATLAIFVSLAGCGYVPQGEEVHIGYRGTLDTSASDFRMEGNLTAGGGNSDRSVYRDVTVKLYSAEDELLHSESLGDMSTDKNLAMTVSIETIPHYVIFDSPDFWQEPMQVEYYVRMEDDYGVEYATDRGELPVKLTS